MKGILFRPEIWPAKFRVLEEYDKAQTRRVEKALKEINEHSDEWVLKEQLPDGRFWFQHPQCKRDNWLYNRYIKPRYQEGEVVYVKEKALYWVSPILEGVHYEKPSHRWSQCAYQDDPEIPALLADNERLALERNVNKLLDGSPIIGKWEWKSPLLMPEYYARYFIRMKVKPQRVQEITEEDAIAEGSRLLGYTTSMGRVLGKDTYRYSFEMLWNSINPKYPFEMNPWEFTYTFRLEAR